MILCDYKSENLDVHVKASIEDGALVISGHDLGPNVEAFWGSIDYEYFYTLSAKETDQLYRLLKADSKIDGTLLDLIKLQFSDLDGCKNFKQYCEKHHIQYKFFNYFSI